MSPCIELGVRKRSRMFSFLRRKPRIGGLIAHLGLTDWWENSLTAEERATVLARYRPLGDNSQSLIVGDILHTSQSPLHLLWGLASWFKKPEDWAISIKVFEQGKRLIPSSSVIDQHFFHQARIEFFYRMRDHHTNALAFAEAACADQIAIAPQAARELAKQQDGELPSHHGFWQLAVLLEKQGRLVEAVDVCRAAQAGGWPGDWIARADKLNKKVSRLQGV